MGRADLSMSDQKELQLLRSNYYAKAEKLKKSPVLQFTIINFFSTLFLGDGVINI